MICEFLLEINNVPIIYLSNDDILISRLKKNLLKVC